MVPKNSPRTNLAHLVCSISGDTRHRCPQYAFTHSRAPRQYNHWKAKFHCIPTLPIEARQRCIFHLVPAKVRETSMIDWHGSIGQHGPSGACPSHLHEDLADGSILNRKAPRSDAATTTRPLMRHYCTVLTRTMVWIYAVLCGTNQAKCVL